MNAMCRCGRERIAKGHSAGVKTPTGDVSWGICKQCADELENGDYPKVKR